MLVLSYRQWKSAVVAGAALALGGSLPAAFFQGYFLVRLESPEAAVVAEAVEAVEDEGTAPVEAAAEAWVWRAVPLARSGTRATEAIDDGLRMAAPDLDTPEGLDEDSEGDSLFSPNRSRILDDALGRDLEPPPF